jgi:PII-like signaling protein
VDAGGKLPVIIVFVDTDDHVSRVLPKLKEMAAHRLIVRENVVLEQGNLDAFPSTEKMQRDDRQR